MTTKLHMDISQGVADVEGDPELAREVYRDFGIRRETDFAHVEVSDTGAGFAPGLNTELAGRQDALRSRWNGHGLGLTLVRAIARLHGGEVRLERRGETTVAVLTLART